MYISFTKYVSSIPGVYYKGFDGIIDIYEKNNINDTGGLIVPAEHYDATVYKNFINAMIEFKEKPNGIVMYLARSNHVDIAYTITAFQSMEDFLSIGQTSWFQDFSLKRAEYLKLTGITSYSRNIYSLQDELGDIMTNGLSRNETLQFEQVASYWDQQEILTD
jgi:hypothetical protein